MLGYRRNGAPIYAIAGGNGEGEGGSGSSGGEAGGDGGQNGGSAGGKPEGGQGDQQAGAAKGTGQAGSGAGGGTDWEAKYREAVGHSREWEKRAKANSSAADELDKLKASQMTEQEKAVAAAEKAGRTAAASEAQAEISKRDAELRELKVKDAVRDRASTHSAKPGALLNSLSFRDRIKELNPADKTFGANLDEAIKAELEEHPEYAAQGAGQSSGDMSGGTGERAAKRSGSLSGAIANHYQT
ncbi:hypothetical protein [Streptomyces sp. NPDC056785]|uniref:hypothetical protein n=1 Tax=Streptomyces sp. NPDC056785 TaxID=3345944 RepID=UPI00369F8262